VATGLRETERRRATAAAATATHPPASAIYLYKGSRRGLFSGYSSTTKGKSRAQSEGVLRILWR
jgi:hypothetical protein